MARFGSWISGMALFALAAAWAEASVADMRALVSNRPELIAHWTFEGRTVHECMTDELGGLRLRAETQPGGEVVGAFLDQYGPDRTSRCLRIRRDGPDRGQAVRTVGPLRFTREGTVELLFRADGVFPGELNKGWMVHTLGDGGGRLYLAGVSRFREADELIAGFGTKSPFHGGAEVVIAGASRTPPFEKGRWYYLAVTYSHNRRTGAFTADAYLGPVGVAGARLVHAVKKAKRPGIPTPLGDRVVNIGSAGQAEQIFDGLVDEMVLYDRRFPCEVLEAHFAALLQPAKPEAQVDLTLFEPPPLYRVSEELARRFASAYTKEWQHTNPDLVVFLPEGPTGPEAENQHFIVFPLKNGDFFALWTSAYRESHPNQHIVFSKSKDRGLTWSKPHTIAGPKQIEENGRPKLAGMTSWAFPIYVPDKNRIYVFYAKDIGLRDAQGPGFTAEMRFIYTQDDGATWSREYAIPLRRCGITAPDPRIPPNWIVWQMPVEITPGRILACGTIWASKQRVDSDPQALRGSECWFWLFDNILTEDDPTKIRVTQLPDGDHGIRMPDHDGTTDSTAEEPTMVRLTDGRWFCVFRTYRGCIGYSISSDEGHTWSEARPLCYRDGGSRILQPTASCPLYPLSDGRFLLTFHNNDGTANGGKHPWDWRRNRTPAFYSVGKEMLDREQPVWFTPPILFLDNEAKPWGPSGRRSVAVYTSFFEFQGKRWYWYPDRKHFLLGKFITDHMLAEAEKLR